MDLNFYAIKNNSYNILEYKNCEPNLNNMGDYKKVLDMTRRFEEN